MAGQCDGKTWAQRVPFQGESLVEISRKISSLHKDMEKRMLVTGKADDQLAAKFEALRLEAGECIRDIISECEAFFWPLGRVSKPSNPRSMIICPDRSVSDIPWESLGGLRRLLPGKRVEIRRVMYRFFAWLL